MQSPTLTFIWLTWRQYGRILTVAAGFMAAAVVLSSIVPLERLPKTLFNWFGVFEWLAVMLAMLLSLLSVLTYADLQIDVLARESGFPRSMMRLPVHTSSLVIWPMAFAALVPALLWILMSAFVLHPWERFEGSVPGSERQLTSVWWPAAFSAACVAWLQALLWLPVGLRGFRLALIALAAIGLIKSGIETSPLAEPIRVIIFVGLTALAWGVGYAGVRQGRRGVVPDWSWMVAPVSRLLDRSGRFRREFSTARRASDWLLWRMSARALPMATSLFLVVVAVVWSFDSDFHVAMLVSSTVFLLPVLLAGFTGGWAIGGRDRSNRESVARSAWIASMPIANGERLRGVFKAALFGTLAAYMIVLAFACSLFLYADVRSGRTAVVYLEMLRETPMYAVRWGAVGLTILIWTWKRSVNSYLVGTFGRGWIIAESGLWVIFLVAAKLFSVTLIVMLDLKREEPILQGLLAILFTSRLWFATMAIVVGLERRLIDVWTVVWGAALWVVLAGGLIAMFSWSVEFSDGDQWTMALGVLAAFPMVRLAASPLILHASRHQ